MSRDKVLAELQHWRDAKQLYHLSNAHIVMARELGVKPDHLLAVCHLSDPSEIQLLGPRIQELYQERFGKTGPDRVCSIRQLEREEHAREDLRELSARERKEKDEEAWELQVEATRVSLVTIRRLFGGRHHALPRLQDDPTLKADCRHQLKIGVKK
jgi:hypothetical protein